MKKTIFTTVFALTVLITNAQLKVHSSGKVSAGSTTAPTYNLGVTGDIDVVASGNAYRIQGNKALWYNSTATSNIFCGVGAAGTSITSGTKNTFVGNNAGNVITSGYDNSFMGYRAGYSYTTGYNGVAIGSQALYSNTTGYHNTAVGLSALYSNISGIANTAVGLTALYANTGDQNTAIGMQALRFNNSGHHNTASGYQSLYSNTTGSYNTVSGYMALNDNTTGSNNTAIGVGAGTLGLLNTTGSNNTYVGYNATLGTAGLSNATALGNGAIVNASNKVRIGNTYSTIVIEGQTGWSYPSDGRFKNNITEEVKGLSFIKKLRPVNYQFDAQSFDQFLMINMSDSIKAFRTNGIDYSSSASVIHTGFIAQEVEQAAIDCGYIFDGLHAPNDDNDNYSLAYSQFVVPLVKAVQELSKVTDSLTTVESNQDSIINSQNSKIDFLQNQLNQLLTTINNCCAFNGTRSMQSPANNIQQFNQTDVKLTNAQSIVLEQNVPNPFAEQTTINYSLPDNTVKAQMLFYNAQGKLIQSTELTQKGKGMLNVFASDLSNGIYTYTLVVDGKIVETKKMVKQ